MNGSSAKVACALLLASTGCRAIFGLEEGPGQRPGGDAASPVDAASGGPWWVGENAEGCEVVRPPQATDRPEVADGESLNPIYLALDSLRVGADEDLNYSPNAWQSIGLDLDGRCRFSPTCAGVDQPSCAGPTKDGNECRDNALGALVKFGDLVVPRFTEKDWNCELLRGGFNIVIRLRGYNGRADDPHVRLDVFTSIGVDVPPETVTCDGGSAQYQWWIQGDTFQGDRPWCVLPEAVVSTDKCRGNDSDAAPRGADEPDASACSDMAFVRDGYLAATFTDAVFWLNGMYTQPISGFRTSLARAAFVGQLQREENIWYLKDATLGGVTTAAEVLEAFRAIGYQDQVDGGGSVAVNLNRTLVQSQDMLLDPSLPDTSKCDALSVGWQFSARQTGGVRVVPSAADADAGEHPCRRYVSAP